MYLDHSLSHSHTHLLAHKFLIFGLVLFSTRKEIDSHFVYLIHINLCIKRLDLDSDTHMHNIELARVEFHLINI